MYHVGYKTSKLLQNNTRTFCKLDETSFTKSKYHDFCIHYRPQLKFGTRLCFQKRLSVILSTGGSASRGVGQDPPPAIRKAGGTHPTGMLSCFVKGFCFRFHIYRIKSMISISSLPKLNAIIF